MIQNLSVFSELPGSYVVLDIETTGLPDDEGLPGIVTLGIVKVLDRKLSCSFEFKLRPHRRIKEEAEKVHGISNDEAKAFNSFQEKWPVIREWLNDQLIVIHNANFDWPIIDFHVRRHELELAIGTTIFCSQKSAIEFASKNGIPMSDRGPSLDDLSEFLGIESMRCNGTHGAEIDAIQTAFVVEELRRWSTAVP